MIRGHLIGRGVRVLVVVSAAAVLVGGCSMAGLPSFKPATGKVATATAAAPKPAQRAARAEAFEPFAFVEAPAHGSSVDALISKYAGVYDVPESLIRRVVQRESGFNPKARNGPYYGLMQIRHDTARSMGYSGSAAGLLDADTNLRYAVKYLRGAYLVAGYNADGAIRNYSRGYYYDAKKLGLLREVGLN